MISVNDACTGLAFTGLGYSVLAIVIIAIASLTVGVIVLRRAKRRGRLGASVALLLALGVCVAVGMAGPSPASAATPSCGGSSPAPSTTRSMALTVVQTSAITDLAPGVPATLISGMSTNTGPDGVFVEMVVVRVESVTKAPDAAAGSCTAANYVILNPQMPVNKTVPSHGSTQFTGATIGFYNRVTNQDACKGATVHLKYEVYES